MQNPTKKYKEIKNPQTLGPCPIDQSRTAVIFSENVYQGIIGKIQEGETKNHSPLTSHQVQ